MYALIALPLKELSLFSRRLIQSGEQFCRWICFLNSDRTETALCISAEPAKICGTAIARGFFKLWRRSRTDDVVNKRKFFHHNLRIFYLTYAGIAAFVQLKHAIRRLSSVGWMRPHIFGFVFLMQCQPCCIFFTWWWLFPNYTGVPNAFRQAQIKLGSYICCVAVNVGFIHLQTVHSFFNSINHLCNTLAFIPLQKLFSRKSMKAS